MEISPPCSDVSRKRVVTLCDLFSWEKTANRMRSFEVLSWKVPIGRGRRLAAPFPVPAHRTGRGEFPYRSRCGVVVRAAILTGIGVLAVSVAVPAPAAERSAASFVSPDAAYNAKWDECEALARSRGTPPGTTCYGDVIEGCVRKACPSHLNPDGPEGKHTWRGRAEDQADRHCY
jgi:hypothetical protein